MKLKKWTKSKSVTRCGKKVLPNLAKSCQKSDRLIVSNEIQVNMLRTKGIYFLISKQNSTHLDTILFKNMNICPASTTTPMQGHKHSFRLYNSQTTCFLN